MIAKIYGKSTKFVVNNTWNESYINDQYKRPKIQHMKDIIRQKTVQKSEKKQTTQNLKKIKIEASKLQNIQVVAQRKTKGSQLEKES